MIDQSRDERTACALVPFSRDPRFRYLHSDSVGLGRARNIGLAAADSELVAFTDDDCEVPAGWLAELARVFRMHPAVAVAFCNVEPGPHDRRAGFIPAYRRRRSALLRTIGDKARVQCMGAGMAVRRSATRALGGFDPLLGPGATFPSADDRDIAVRALLLGHEVYHTAEVAVVHHGFRTWAEGRALAERDWLGIGGAYAKPLRCGAWRFLPVLLAELGGQVFAPMAAALLHMRRPRGLTRLGGFARGFMRSLRLPVDRRTITYRAPAAEHASTSTRGLLPRSS